MSEKSEFQTKLEEVAAKQYKALMTSRETLVEAWLAETGLLPSQCELVEEDFWEDDKLKTIIYIRRRSNRQIKDINDEMEDECLCRCPRFMHLGFIDQCIHCNSDCDKFESINKQVK